MAHEDCAGLLYPAAQLADPYGYFLAIRGAPGPDADLRPSYSDQRLVRQPPDTIIRMTHAKLPTDCQSLVRVKYPQQSCRSCASRLKRDGATGAVLKSWMQGWRVTCRACSGALTDVWSDVNR